MAKETMKKFLSARANMYRLLADLFLLEVDETKLAKLQALTFPATGDDDMDKGYALIKEYLDGAKAEELDWLAADYAKTFLAAGNATGKAAFPYESIYVDTKHMLGGSTDQKMEARLLAKGYKAREDRYRTFYDHIGLEFEYVAILIDEQIAALDADDMAAYNEALDQQKTFVKEDLLTWVSSFTSDIAKYADTGFYKGLGRVTHGFMQQEKEILAKGGDLWDIR